MNAAARPHRPANDSRAPFARPANTSAPGPALPPTALPPTALPPTALPTVAAASGATNEPIRSMPTVRPIPGTGPLTLLSLAGANDA
ncbi:MAG TPA: hypothetical protein PLI18_01275, partial [Pirellulaceae bacterium]|nr:hypothetical protein [Pirellulaceae bacterium]